MKKITLGVLMMIVLLLLTLGGVSALPENRGTERAEDKSPAIDEEKNVVAPPTFVEPPFPQLAESELTKIVFIRYAPGKEPMCNNDGICEPRENWKQCSSDCPKGGGGGGEPTPTPAETVCYDFLAGSKPKWNWVEDYYYSDSTLEIPSSNAVTTWEAATSGNIFDSGTSGTGTYLWGTYDFVNSLSYGNYNDTGICQTSDPCVIAVTAIWYRGKNIYEYDILFDTDFFPSDTIAIDLPTVVLHEVGHGAGLNDLYNQTCADNVMYGYYHGVDLDLGPGDVAGIQKLYGQL